MPTTRVKSHNRRTPNGRITRVRSHNRRVKGSAAREIEEFVRRGLPKKYRPDTFKRRTKAILRQNIPEVKNAIYEAIDRLDQTGQAIVKDKVAGIAVGILVSKGIIGKSSAVYAKPLILALIV